MPGLAGRMSTVIKAKISRMLDQAEDPAETLDYGYQKQVELLQNVKKGIADVVTSKKRLQMQSQKLEQKVVKLDTQARQALAQGREDLARTALERKTLAQTELQSLDSRSRSSRASRSSSPRTSSACARRSSSSGRRRKSSRRSTRPPRRRSGSPRPPTASARRWPTSGSRCSAPRTRPRRCAHAPPPSRSSRQAGAFDDITQLGSGEDDIDRQLAELTSGAQVDDELAKMKAELGSGRRRLARPRAGGGQGVIVRISGEGQYRLPDEDAERLNELDNRAVNAVEQGDETGFKELWSQMLEIVASDGNALDEEELRRVGRDHPAARHQLRRGAGASSRARD